MLGFSIAAVDLFTLEDVVGVLGLMLAVSCAVLIAAVCFVGALVIAAVGRAMHPPAAERETVGAERRDV